MYKNAVDLFTSRTVTREGKSACKAIVK